VTRQPEVTLGLVGRKIVEDDMDFLIGIVGDNLVHEVEEFDAATSFVMPAGYFAGGNVQRGE
jgi:hypothetical protein